MKRTLRHAVAALAAALTLGGCAHTGGPGWTALVDDGKGLENFERVGDANWRTEQNLLVADRGKGGHLVTKKSYRDFVLVAEFYAETDTNSGLFLHIKDPKTPGANNSYEVNIWDIRPDPKYGTGAIVDYGSVPVPLRNKAGGRWNTFEIHAQGSRITVKLNGEVTTSIDDRTHAAGPLSLQYGFGVQGAMGGPIKWRRVLIREL